MSLLYAMSGIWQQSVCANFPLNTKTGKFQQGPDVPKSKRMNMALTARQLHNIDEDDYPIIWIRNRQK